ncbi:hypothetical protein SDC9_86140 [bioreactor metagenome]|uniref:Uncharacterized protein n=1 Tax=bioreactor metagenome TaxID=1076179 RepID=A0A644ZF82_9ZZZZ
MTVGVDNRVDRADELCALGELVEVLNHVELMRNGAVDAAHLKRFQAFDRVLELVGINVDRQKAPERQTHIPKRRFLYHHAGILRRGMAEHADQTIQIILLFHLFCPFSS